MTLYDAADYLTSERARAEYLKCWLEDGSSEERGLAVITVIRSTYNETAKEPLPDDFKELLDKLK